MWKLRYWQQGRPKPEVIEVYDDRGIGIDLQALIDKHGATRVEAVRRGHPAEPKKKPPVKVQRIEWEQDESFPKGEKWVGRVHGKQVATAVHLSDTWGGSCHYSLNIGEFTEYGGKSANIETAKRAAQSAFTKFVNSLLG